jgi:hypothetical protein
VEWWRTVLTCDNWADLEGVEGSSLEETDGYGASYAIRFPNDIDRRSGSDVLVLSGRSDCVEASGLGNSGGSKRHDGSRDERVTHGGLDVWNEKFNERGVSEIQY